MRKSTLALVCGTAGLILGSLLSNHLSAAATSYGEDRAQIYNEGSAKWQYKGAGNPAW